MFKHLDSVDTAGIGTVGIYDDEQAFRTGQAPLRTFRLKAKPTKGQSVFDALTEQAAATDADSPELGIEALKNAVQAHLDATAQADDWDSIYTAALRASFAGPYQANGIAYATWMDACWLRCHEVEAEVLAGKRAVPSADELIGLLPVFKG